MAKNDIKFLCRGIQKRNICGDSKSKKRPKNFISRKRRKAQQRCEKGSKKTRKTFFKMM